MHLKHKKIERACVLVLLLAAIQGASAAQCDLSSDGPNECLMRRLDAANKLTTARTASLQNAVRAKVSDSSDAAARYAETVRKSDAAWRTSVEENCSIVEATYFDGSARLNAVMQCQLDEADLRNARLKKLLSELGSK